MFEGGRLNFEVLRRPSYRRQGTEVFRRLDHRSAMFDVIGIAQVRITKLATYVTTYSREDTDGGAAAPRYRAGVAIHQRPRVTVTKCRCVTVFRYWPAQ